MGLKIVQSTQLKYESEETAVEMQSWRSHVQPLATDMYCRQKHVGWIEQDLTNGNGQSSQPWNHLGLGIHGRLPRTSKNLQIMLRFTIVWRNIADSRAAGADPSSVFLRLGHPTGQSLRMDAWKTNLAKIESFGQTTWIFASDDLLGPLRHYLAHIGEPAFSRLAVGTQTKHPENIRKPCGSIEANNYNK